jgi:hypothetical protein
MPTAPQASGQHHYVEAEQGLAQLGSIGLDEPERVVETLAALTHATLAIAATLASRGKHPVDDETAFGHDY